MNAGGGDRRALLRGLVAAPLAWWAARGAGADAAGSVAGAGRVPAAAGPARAFPLERVRLLPGPFLDAQRRDLRYLLSLDPDRLLHNFRVNAGLAPRAPVYGGWESEEPWVGIRCHGHTLGHVLAACAQMVAATGDPACRQRVDHIVAELQACQRQRGDGLVCAFPDGDVPLQDALAGRPFQGVPWYTLHKVMAGLRDAHLYAGNAQARDVLLGLAAWVRAGSEALDDGQLQRMLEVEHGGMCEVLADIHALTGDAADLALARRWAHRALLEPLARGEDRLDGLHANTQVPKAIGAARLHELAGDPAAAGAAEAFWSNVAGRRSYATGGHGDNEHFFPPGEFAQRLGSAKTMETCGTHNMLRLTLALARREPRAALADYAERALFNGILGSQDPDTGLLTYFQATRPGYPKLYCTPDHSFWCCTGTGLENHARHGEFAYLHVDDALYVQQFMASTLDWHELGVRLTQSTRFPEEPRTRLAISCARPVRFALRVRRPAWCSAPRLAVNGRFVAAVDAAGGYLELRRTWRDGDVVDVELPMALSLEPLPGSAGIAAVLFGPIVLAGRLGHHGIGPGDDLLANERLSGEVLDEPMQLPALARAPGTPGVAVRASGAPLVFSATLSGGAQVVSLAPFHRIAHERYNLYWRVA